ncbi:tryptophan halogenase family protein [Marinagarivorans algicola]|uniref:tryptophan halogenase family protein n=1 Tax=Marinagarivorans algicola TaxID=1513270 RepID=UPI0006BA0120|nr:tryptophan halogenase family protein [Marinagarivorans algicola]
MIEQKVKKVVIAGGGTAGWITAAALSSQLGRLLDITLIESDSIGTVGVGEATIPTHKSFHQLLGIDERQFMKATRATFKLGIAFENWGQQGDRYFHSFGKVGRSTWMGHFQHMWQYANEKGLCGDIDDYCLELQAAEAGKFSLSDKANINYAYHLDAGLYAKFLRDFSEKRGVKREEGKINNVSLCVNTGFIESLTLDNGQLISGDLFIDCTGFKGILIGSALNVELEDWRHWLPVNRALAVQTTLTEEVQPYTRSMAHEAGWQWRIPLQNRIGNGFIYSNDHMSDDQAYAGLMANIQGDTVSDPKLIHFSTGKRKYQWYKNCVSLGLSSGFLEPLESTSIHLIQVGITRLIQMFPFDGVNDALRSRFNDVSNAELTSIRDFLIAHYKLNKRPENFWRERAELDLPDSLQQRLDLYKASAIAYQDDSDLFRVDSWNQVLRGQGLRSEGYHKMGYLVSDAELKRALADLKSSIEKTVNAMPKHTEFLHQYGIK